MGTQMFLYVIVNMVVLVNKDKEEDHVWVILDDGSRVHISWLEGVEKKNEITSN
jgi:hypothetical protein|tara:strand:+ start:250 stop:411 length:162 start_codon:yes stop_codon:yes gene_type:complete